MSSLPLVWLGEVADRSGLTAGFSQVLASAPRRHHDPGVTLVQLAMVSTVTVTFEKQGEQPAYETAPILDQRHPRRLLRSPVGMIPDEESMRYWAAGLERADALLFGQVTYEMMEAAWRQPATGTWPDWMADWEIPSPGRSTGQRSTSSRAPWTGSIGTRSWCRVTWESRSAAQAGAWRRPVRGRRDPPAGVGGSGIDR